MTTVLLSLDRHAALVRAVWRLLAAVVLGGFVAFVVRRIEWEQYWRDQRIVGLSWALILAVVSLPALGLAVSGIRWLFAGLSAKLGVELNDSALIIRAGPFGNQAFDWKRMRLKLDGDMAPETWVSLPADAVGMSLFHPTCAGDLFDRIRLLLGTQTSTFVTALRERLHLIER